MRILWIVNITMPDASEKLGMARPNIGGWLTGYQDALLQMHGQEVELHIVQPALIGSPCQLTTGDAQQVTQVTHHIFPHSWLQSAYAFTAKPSSRLSPLSNQLASYLIQVNADVKPEVVHIHGSEFPHSLAWIEACGCEHTLVSIQGLTSVYARYYMAGLTHQEQRPTFHDRRYRCSLARMQQELANRGESERLLLQKVTHVAGRTSWDYSHALAINPSAVYHTLQEVLRQEFYDTAYQWQLERCQRHTIFVSQSHYPIKGLHKLLEAMPLVLRRYPDAQLRIVGNDPTCKRWWQRTTYANILRKRISACPGLSQHITYLGSLSASQMAEEYRKAHVFICPSAIENSSNSACEAQLLGTPVVASYVGGLMDLVSHEYSGLLYRFEETEMLAEQICRIFADDTLAQRLSEGARSAASIRHSREDIAHTLYNIYREVTDGS